MVNLVATVKNFFTTPFINGLGFQSVRYSRKGGLGGWTDHRMIRDHGRRQTVMKLYPERLKLNTLHRNDILPIELRNAAKEQVKTMHMDSNYIRVHERCVITSRGKGICIPWRMSRIFWRHLADYNKLAGIQRAKWINN